MAFYTDLQGIGAGEHTLDINSHHLHIARHKGLLLIADQRPACANRQAVTQKADLKPNTLSTKGAGGQVMGQMMIDLHLHRGPVFIDPQAEHGEAKDLKRYGHSLQGDIVTTGIYIILKGHQSVGKDITALTGGALAFGGMTLLTGGNVPFGLFPLYSS